MNPVASESDAKLASIHSYVTVASTRRHPGDYFVGLLALAYFD